MIRRIWFIKKNSRIKNNRVIQMANKYNIFTILLVFILLLSFLFAVNQASISEPRTIDSVFTDWTELISSRKSAIAMLPSYADFPENATLWEDYAEKSIEDLLTFDNSWFIEPVIFIV